MLLPGEFVTVFATVSATCVHVVALSLPVATERALPGADELDVVEEQAGGALMQVRRARRAQVETRTARRVDVPTVRSTGARELT